MEKKQFLDVAGSQEFLRLVMEKVQAGTVSPEALAILLAEYVKTSEMEEATSDFFDGAEYDKGTKRINFKNGENVKAYIDASDFIKDGMIDTVTLENGTETNTGKTVLKFVFNTDAGKEAIEVPVAGIFDPENYYDKTAIDNLLQGYASTTALEGLQTEVEGKVDTETYEADKAGFETKENAAKTYQPIGEYLTEEDLEEYAKTEDVEGMLDDYVKADEIESIPLETIQGWFND